MIHTHILYKYKYIFIYIYTSLITYLWPYSKGHIRNWTLEFDCKIKASPLFFNFLSKYIQQKNCLYRSNHYTNNGNRSSSEKMNFLHDYLKNFVEFFKSQFLKHINRKFTCLFTLRVQCIFLRVTKEIDHRRK